MEQIFIIGGLILGASLILLGVLRPVIVWLNGNSDVIKNQKRIIELLEKNIKE